MVILKALVFTDCTKNNKIKNKIHASNNRKKKTYAYAGLLELTGRTDLRTSIEWAGLLELPERTGLLELTGRTSLKFTGLLTGRIGLWTSTGHTG